MKFDMIVDAQDHITHAAVRESATNLAEPGAVLIVVRSGILQRTLPVAIASRQIALNQDLKAIQPNENLSPEFLAYAFRAFDHEILRSCSKTGTTVQSIEVPALMDFEFPVPALSIQRRIVAEIEKHFTRLDAAVAALRRVQANLKRYRAAVLKAACEGRLVPTEAELAKQERRTFQSGEQLLNEILDERRRHWAGRGKYKEPMIPTVREGTERPKGWALASVEAVGTVQLGRQRAPKHHRGSNMRPYLRVANVFDDRIDITDLKSMNFTPDEFEVYRLHRNDILLNEGQSLELVGRAAIYQEEAPDACFTNTLVRFRSSPNINVKFALITFRANMYSGKFQKIARWTTNIAHLGADRFAKMEFLLPPRDEQDRIVAQTERHMSIIEKMESMVTENLLRAQNFRQSILKKAFSGELV